MIRKMLQKIKNFLSKDILLENEELKEEIEILNKELYELGKSLIKIEDYRDKLIEEIDEKNKQIIDLNVIIDILKISKINKDEKFWNNKHPKKLILYPARSLPFSETKCPVPITVLITPNDRTIYEELVSWDLVGNDETDWETHIPDIYHKIREEYFKYEKDINTWGKPEVWEFPFELKAKIFLDNSGFDCDSWSHFIVSYFRAAGFPAWRVRVVVGDTDIGAHSTIYVYSEESKKWHHLNSTFGRRLHRISDFPTHKDAEDGFDKLGIKKVWFSFNDKFSWSTFDDIEDMIVK